MTRITIWDPTVMLFAILLDPGIHPFTSYNIVSHIISYYTMLCYTITGYSISYHIIS